MTREVLGKGRVLWVGGELFMVASKRKGPPGCALIHPTPY